MSTSSSKLEQQSSHPKWTFLTNHTHVLVCISQENVITVRELSQRIGITERSVQRIISELLESKVITRTKVGRNNSYTIEGEHPLHHPLEASHSIQELLNLIR